MPKKNNNQKPNKTNDNDDDSNQNYGYKKQNADIEVSEGRTPYKWNDRIKADTIISTQTKSKTPKPGRKSRRSRTRANQQERANKTIVDNEDLGVDGQEISNQAIPENDIQKGANQTTELVDAAVREDAEDADKKRQAIHNSTSVRTRAQIIEEQNRRRIGIIQSERGNSRQDARQVSQETRYKEQRAIGSTLDYHDRTADFGDLDGAGVNMPDEIERSRISKRDDQPAIGSVLNKNSRTPDFGDLDGTGVNIPDEFERKHNDIRKEAVFSAKEKKNIREEELSSLREKVREKEEDELCL